MTNPVVFQFDGSPIAAQPGQTIAAALTAVGRRILRTAQDGTGRGIYCGMGVCHECLVTIDGLPNVRACMTKAVAHLDVRAQRFPGEPQPSCRGQPPATLADLETVETDLLVVGGGAGGLSAALAARRAGLDVLVLDERTVAGGQYYKQPADDLQVPPLDRQQADGAVLRGIVEAAGVRVRDGATVLMPVSDTALLVTQAGQAFVARGKALVVATGAYERAIPISGWTEPGVMTTGALQTLWRSYRTLPGKRIAIAGNGPLNLQVADELIRAGAEVTVVAEAAPATSITRAGALARMAIADPRLAAAGLAMTARVRRAGARLRFGAFARAIERHGRDLVVSIGPPDGRTEQFAVDVVGLGYGFEPSNELLRALGCAHTYDTTRATLRTQRDRQCETSVANVFAVGDCCGLGGAPAAMAEGVVAGTAVAARLGSSRSTSLLMEGERAQVALARHHRFQVALWSLYRAPGPGLSLATDSTIVCRCEGVRKADLLRAAADGDPDIGAVKRRTRCGMGRCQGRYCGPLLAAHLAATHERVLDERALFAPRGPFKPFAIADLTRSLRHGRD